MLAICNWQVPLEALIGRAGVRIFSGNEVEVKYFDPGGFCSLDGETEGVIKMKWGLGTNASVV